jgi:hypothetical protein
MIAHCAKHPGLQISKGHVVGKANGVDLSVVVTVWIAAINEHPGSPEASHIRERHGLIVKQKIWDRPRHFAIKLRNRTGKQIVPQLGLEDRPVLKWGRYAGASRP